MFRLLVCFNRYYFSSSVLTLVGITLFLLITTFNSHSQIIISQYYEGAGTNKWIELTNMGSSPINTTSPQLKLGLWSVAGSAGNIAFTGSATQTLNLNFTIPAYGTVLIGNTGNGTEVPYLTSGSAIQNSNTVINFNGNDGVALLDAANNVLDRFGTGINAADISYIRTGLVSTPSNTFISSQWSAQSLSTVQTSNSSLSNYLGFHISMSCTTPLSQPGNLVFSGLTNVSVTGAFASTSNADEYIILRSTSSTLTQLPVDGITYQTNDVLGNALVQYRGSLNNFTATGLSYSTTYYFTIFSIKSLSCNGGPKYRTSSPLAANVTTNSNCDEPHTQPSNFQINTVTSNTINASYSPVSTAENYLVLRGTQVILTAQPLNGVLYNPGDVVGNYSVVYRGSNTSFSDWGLEGNTPYYYRIFSAKTSNCVGGIRYRTANPLKGSVTTQPTQYYTFFGNLHSHSELSDGSGSVGTDMAFGDAAQCMDFLGISDHNHTSAGMTLANWNLGVASAKSYSTSSFCALYGMEWGTISGGGHVLIYGTDSLMGWDSAHYQIYVPQTSYLGSGGLFEKVNEVNPHTFAMLAHPGSSDFNDIVDIYDTTADAVLVGCAVENGPSTSTNTTYNDYPASMAYLSYYRSMLARGYHVGPTIDHDNHQITHGHTAYSRTAVLSASIAKHHILDAFKQRRFYATQDCGAYVSFQLNGFDMGNMVTMAGVPTINVNAITSSPVTSLKIYSGIPGSTVNATILTSTSGPTLSYSHTALSNMANRYYYIDITEADGKRIITAPIWYTRNDGAIPVDPGMNTEQDVKPALGSDESSLNVFPNPCSDRCYFALKDDYPSKGKLHISDMTGLLVVVKTMKPGEVLDMDMSYWKKGLYFYTFESERAGKIHGVLTLLRE